MPKPMYVWTGTAWVSVASEVESLATYATQSYADNTPGMRMIIPASVSVGSGSGSVSTQGAVTFTTASSVSLNTLFSSSYNNYRIIVNFTASSANNAPAIRLRSGTTDSTGSVYERAGYYNLVNSSSVLGANNTGQTSWNLGNSTSANPYQFNFTLDLFNPFSAVQTTASFASTATAATPAFYSFHGGLLHTASTSYDGLTLFPDTGTISGSIRVYGYKNG